MWGKVNKNSRNADALSPFLCWHRNSIWRLGVSPLALHGKFFFSCKTPLIVTGNFFFSCERPLIVTGNFFSRANDPRLLREIFFLVRNTLDCYGKFFFSCKTPLIVTGNFFSRANDPRLHKKRGHFCRRNTPLKQIKKMRFYFIVMHRSRTAR